jgi:predicted Zn-dependent protease with MMP-like domain
MTSTPQPDEFHDLLESVVRELPPEFRDKLRNVAILVEDYPSDELLDEMGIPEDETLFGLFDGTPLTERGYFEDPVHPDRIFIFRKAIEDECDSPEEIREELRITLMHEIAHFFGMDEDAVDEAGYG